MEPSKSSLKAIGSSFLGLSILLVGRFRHPRPGAGNAKRQQRIEKNRQVTENNDAA